jgi:hypothetical protein
MGNNGIGPILRQVERVGGKLVALRSHVHSDDAGREKTQTYLAVLALKREERGGAIERENFPELGIAGLAPSHSQANRGQRKNRDNP